VTPPLVVAEIGGNHRGEMSTALRMIEVAARYCREHFRLDGSVVQLAVKFQKRTPRLRPQDFERPHPNPYHAYGATYGEHREALEFDADQHAELKAKCDAEGVIYSSSVWDIPAAEAITRLHPAWVKVPSAHNLDWPLLGYLIAWGGELHISLGMTTRAETDELVRFLTAHGAMERTVLYHCVSDYPVRPEDVRLDEIGLLDSRYGPGSGRRHAAKSIGFSGHHNGIAVDMAAAIAGVSHIERHFTLNRTWRGTDHAASLEPDGLRKLLRGVCEVSAARGDKGSTGLLETEAAQRAKLKHMEAA